MFHAVRIQSEFIKFKFVGLEIIARKAHWGIPHIHIKL